MCFLRWPQKLNKSSPPIWEVVHNVKSTVKILSIFVAFLEKMNFMCLLNYSFNYLSFFEPTSKDIFWLTHFFKFENNFSINFLISLFTFVLSSVIFVVILAFRNCAKIWFKMPFFCLMRNRINCMQNKHKSTKDSSKSVYLALIATVYLQL